MSPLLWSLVQFRADDSAEIGLGVLIGDGVRALPAGWPVNAVALLDDWRAWEQRLRSLDVEALAVVEGARLIAPITYPRKIICAGANYSDHAAEMGEEAPTTMSRPFFFLKPPTTTVIGPGATIVPPVSDGVRMDWEVELGVVMADRVKRVEVADAASHVAGYVVANDISARGLFHRKDAIAPPFTWDWFEHKALDGFCPIGPGLVPSWLVDDAEDLRISLAVNGVVKQDSTTGKLIAGIPELVSAVSQHVTLEPGDLILTGTPAGVGMPRGEFLSPGDQVVAEIEGIGRLENIVAQPDGHRAGVA